MVMPEPNKDMFVDDPLESYKNIYKDLHAKNVNDFFEDLTVKSDIKIEPNVTTVKEIRKLEGERYLVKKKLNNRKGLKGFLIFLCVISIMSLAFNIYSYTDIPDEMMYLYLAIASFFLGVFSLVLILSVLNKQIRVLQQMHFVLDQKINTLMQIAWTQMQPLNQLFYEGMNKQLFQQTLPLIQFDELFETKRLHYMIQNFGFVPNNNINRSTVFIQSGEIKGNPFFFGQTLIHKMETAEYSGSITITWTTTSTVNGQKVTQHHSQVLTATISKPCPRYYNQYSLTYANDAAPDLTFSREDSDAEHMSEKKIDKMVNSQIKKLEKLSQKTITQGGSFMVMGNSEFEVLFGAKNRNHEVQFRLLFTPLAQKQLLSLMKEKTIGYGDDFDFVKDKKINTLFPEHLDDYPLNPPKGYFQGYEYADIKNRFIQYQNNYFKSIYFSFAPLLAIPLYQQTMPKEYIYGDLYSSNVSFYEHEKTVNHMNENQFKHPLCSTRNILKTNLVSSDATKDIISVTAYGYKTEERIEIVTKFGGDGRYHQIPVNWTEYLPVNQTKQVEIDIVKPEETMSYKDQLLQSISQLKNRNITEKDMFFMNSLIAHVIHEKK